ncbi:MAG: S1C family serine protease [Caldilineaceae bacterium]
MSQPRRPIFTWTLFAAALALLLVLPARVDAATGLAQRLPPVTPREETSDSEPISTLEDAYTAVVQIEAVGTFEDPAEGLQLNAAGRGTGFIIDESGVAVTNNHVVTGGGLYRVFVDGYDEPLNARVLGVSECADLAVIDIQGEGFPYLAWYDGPIRVGLDVYALGFPLGDPEFTMTRGIVAKASADGDTPWASISKSIQHDADIEPGNSGGPLVDADGRVVAINYSKNAADQYFAIARDEALAIIDELRNGNDVNSLGINGEAVSDGEDLYGIWVASVKSGSPADKAGIRPGDILLSMEGVELGADGTMGTYCEVLRSHSPEDVLSIEVLRFKTQEVLEGQINGRPLQQSFSFADTAPEQQNTGSGSGSTPVEAYDSYQQITDEQGILAVEVPSAWSDVSEAPWTNDADEQIGIRLYASPDFDAWNEDWGVPGVVLSYSDILAADYGPEDILDIVDYSEDCTFDSRNELPDGALTGVYDRWVDCGDAGSSALLLALQPEAGDYLVRIDIYTTNEADLEASDRILDTFLVTSPTAQSDTGDERSSTSEQATPSVLRTIDDLDTGELANDYVFVEDVAVSALLPAAWDDVDAGDWEVDGDAIGSTYAASTNQRAFNDGWDTAGVTIYSAETGGEEFNPADAVDSNDFSDTCTYADRYQHEHTIYGITYTGVYDVWTDCGDEDNTFVVLAAASDPVDHVVLVYFLAVDDPDYEAFDVLARTFYVETAGTTDLIAETANSRPNRARSNAEDYVLLVDDDDALSLRVPVTWDDVANDDWEIDGEVVGRSIAAATDLQDFFDRWDTAGVFAGVSASLAEEFAPADILDAGLQRRMRLRRPLHLRDRHAGGRLRSLHRVRRRGRPGVRGAVGHAVGQQRHHPPALHVPPE